MAPLALGFRNVAGGVPEHRPPRASGDADAWGDEGAGLLACPAGTQESAKGLRAPIPVLAIVSKSSV